MIKRRFNVYVPELHYRKESIRASSEEDAIGRVYQAYGDYIGTSKYRDLDQDEVEWMVEDA